MIPSKYIFINYLKWWIGGLIWDIGVEMSWMRKEGMIKTIGYELVSLGGHRYAFENMDEWIEHHLLYVPQQTEGKE